jgi:hypothetical protein
MMNQISSRDWEALSAYLDGQLTQKDRLRLEQKLRASSDLRLALEELSRTRTILRSQPSLRAPRSFTLTPEMVGIRRERRPAARLYPAFSFVSALASLLFVVVLLGSFLTRGSNQASPAPAAESAQSAPAFLATEPPSVKAFAPMAQQPTQQANESAADQATEQMLSSAQMAPEGTPTGQPSLELGAGQPLQTPTPEAPPSVAGAQRLAPIPTQSEPPESPNETPEAFSQALPATQPALIASPETQETLHVNISPSIWPILEGLLAFIAIGSGLLAFYIRRTMR